MKSATAQELAGRRRAWRCWSLGASLGLLMVLSPPAWAQTQESLGFGLSAGKVGGHGFSVRKLPMEGHGYQAGGIYIRTSSVTFFILGGEGLYVLKRTPSTALYLAYGLSYMHHRWDDDEWVPVWNDGQYQGEYNTRVRHWDKGVSAGGGIGFALALGGWERMWISGDLMLTAYHNTVLPLPQGAVHYLFR